MIEVEHSNTLKAQMLALPEKMRKSIERRAVSVTNKEITESLKSLAPKDSGALQKSMKSVIRTYKSGRIAVGISGPDYDYTGYVVRKPKGKTFKKAKKGEQGLRRPAKYAHLVNNGTQERTTKNGRKTGKVQGIQFLEKVIAANKDRFIDNVSAAVNEALN